MTLPASGAIAFSCINTELGYSSTAAVSLNDTAVRGLFGQASGAIDMNTGHGKSNTSVPGAPTSVSGSSATCSSVSVSFSAPACNGHLTIDTYQAISTPGCITASSSSSPISVTGLSSSTSYTFRVRAHNSKGYGSYSLASGSITTSAAAGSQSYTTAGTYTWVAPAGVTSVSVVVVGAGGNGGARYSFFCCCYQATYSNGGAGGGGGGLSYSNNIPVTPGTGYAIKVAAAVNAGSGSYNNPSYFWATTRNNGSGYFCSSIHAVSVTGACGAAPGNSWTSEYSSPSLNNTGGTGGLGACTHFYGGGAGGGAGAAGYGNPGTSACGGGGGAGYGGYGYSPPYGYGGGSGGSTGGGAATCYNAYGGGGVGLFGRGCSGVGGPGPRMGYGGSGGSNSSGKNGGNYGGGGGGQNGVSGSGAPGSGAGGAVRIVWPGSSRTFPSTCVGA
jgi:hypothetical protein